MKIIHCADIHIDCKILSGLDAKKREIKRNQLLQNFVDMVEYAKKNDIKAILLCGDIFDSPVPKKKSLNIFEKTIFNSPEIMFFYVYGNHDENFYPFAENRPKNFVSFDENFGKVEIDENIVIGGISLKRFMPKSYYSTINFDADKFNIFMVHGSVNTSDKYFEGIYTSNLMNKNINYLALGHIHEVGKGKIDSRGIWQYCGCLEGKGFGDACGIGEKKGFFVLDINGQELKTNFVPFSKYDYRVIEIKIDNSDYLKISKKLEEIANALTKTDIVKIVITGKHDEENDLNINLLKQKFEDRFFYLDIIDNTKVNYDFEKYSAEKLSLKGEFLRTVFSSELSEEDKEKVATFGIEALKGDDVTL